MTVLTEELLAQAERVYLMAQAREEARASSYDWKSGITAILQDGWPVEERMKWLI
jgi:hypothetical protein